MPELPEVESIRRMLSDRLVGHKIEDIQVLLPRIVRHGDIHVLTDRTVVSVERIGKWLKFVFDTGLSMYAHLRMTGTFLWSDDLQTPPTHIRTVFQFDHGRLLYRDIRTFGGFWLMDAGETPWKRLGPDPFTTKFSAAYLKDVLSKRSVAIKVALLNQEVVAGIGNIYASEILYRARINPVRSSKSLAEPELKLIVQAARDILNASIESGGTTFRDFRLSDGKEGAFRDFLKVYGKANEPCLSCNKAIERIVQAQRSTFYCPTCQPHA